MKSLKKTIMERDGMTESEADELIKDAKEDLHNRIAAGENPQDICEEWFGLEPDYIFELL